jgi:hypothetical protein
MTLREVPAASISSGPTGMLGSATIAAAPGACSRSQPESAPGPRAATSKRSLSKSKPSAGRAASTTTLGLLVMAITDGGETAVGGDVEQERTHAAGCAASSGSDEAAATCYFGFATLTTVGYRNPTARTDLRRTPALIEALLGQLYLVMGVSGGVANLVPRRRLGGGNSQ